MSMRLVTFSITPRSAFGTPPKGDTIFGQLCWAIRNRYGNETLESLLEGYTDSRPFMVVSDMMPRGFFPRPVLPPTEYFPGEKLCADKRKEFKKKAWLDRGKLNGPLKDALTENPYAAMTEARSHNTIDRMTGTTGKPPFAPYAVTQTWYGKEAVFDLHVVLDESRFSVSDLKACLEDIGNTGFGRDATTGMGRFDVEEGKAKMPTFSSGRFLTLAPCAPQGTGANPDESYYRTFVRFGRHGDVEALKGRPFKAPVLLADTGAVFTFNNGKHPDFVGRGLGGEKNPLSNAMPETVHQGYAPVVPIPVEGREKK